MPRRRRDAVCGMLIDARHAQSTGHADGQTLYFCSAACASAFAPNPAAYASSLQGAVKRSVSTQIMLRPFGFGVLGMLGLMLFYVGVITLAQGWSHARDQLVLDRWFLGAIMLGFGTQVGLYTYLRGLHGHAAAGGLATSTGTSSVAMLACCAHHLADILPIIGVAGAAVLLNTYKTPLLWLSIGMNGIGIVYLLWKIVQQRQHHCHLPAAAERTMA